MTTVLRGFQSGANSLWIRKPVWLTWAVGAALLLLFEGAAVAQTAPPQTAPAQAAQSASGSDSFAQSLLEGTAASGVALPTKAPSKKPGKQKPEFVIAPIPMVNPTTGNGLALGTALIYQTDPLSPPSVTGVGGLATDNKTWGLGFAQMTNFSKNRYRANLFALYGDLREKFYGTGNAAGDRGVSVPLSEQAKIVDAEFLAAVKKDLFVGMRFIDADVTVSADLRGLRPGDESRNPSLNLPNIQHGFTVAGPGLLVNLDSRDSSFYPTQGVDAKLTADFKAKAFGSDVQYQAYALPYAGFTHSNASNMLAYQFYARDAEGKVPFFALSDPGLKGYVNGRYRDRLAVSGQLEFRHTFKGPFGGVVFVGLGEVAGSFSELNSSNLLGSIGAGLRYSLAKENRVNIGIDYAKGKGSDAIYFHVGENIT